MSAVSFFLRFIYHQLIITPPLPKTDFSGQTIVITGSNTGLGLEAAQHVVRLRAKKVILAVRTLEKGEKAKIAIEKSTRREDVVEVWHLDLSNYASVKNFVKKAEALDRLDAVVENAGIAATRYELFEENESTITTNVVSTFLLGLMILPKLQETATKFGVTPHLAILTSELHFVTNLPEKSNPSIFDSFQDQKTFNADTRYMVSKLLEVFYARELAVRMSQNDKPDVIVNLINPGFCYSELIKNTTMGMKVFQALIARSTEHGSRTLVAGIEAGKESHGQYMSESLIRAPAPFVLSEVGMRTQQRVWDELSAKLEKIHPGIMGNV